MTKSADVIVIGAGDTFTEGGREYIISSVDKTHVHYRATKLAPLPTAGGKPINQFEADVRAGTIVITFLASAEAQQTDEEDEE